MRTAVVASVIAATMGVPFQVFALPLDKGTQDYFEGSWGTHCGARHADAPSDPGMQIEFQRSGGSLRHTDGVDMEARGRIVRTERHHGDAILTTFYSDDEKAKADVKRLRILGKNRAVSLDEQKNGKPITYIRCEKPNRKPVANLNVWVSIDLSLSKRGGTYFAEGRIARNLCGGKPKSWLSFDLVGPVNYSVHHWGESGDELIQIESAAGDRAAVTITGNATSGTWPKIRHEKRTLKVLWLDETHIRVQPWNTEFVRCTY